MAMMQDELLRLINQAAVEGWKELDLSGQGLTEIPDEIGTLTQLEKLILGKGNKDKQGRQEGRYKQVNGKFRFVAFIVGNRLTELPEAISNLLNLRYLDFSGNSLKEIPNWINNLTALEQLSAIQNELRQIPEALGHMKKLQQLNLRENQIVQISETLGLIQDLQKLDLSANKITRIPETLGCMQNLQQLDLRENQITQIPEALGHMQSLQQLDLQKNQITQIPEGLGHMQSLQQLDLSANQITQIPETLGRIEGLQQLNLSANQITQIPETLGRMRNLQQLDLSANKITQIPETLGHMRSLQQLDLSANKITQIPETLGRMRSLQRLDLSANKITQIPETLGRMRSLQQLDLSANKITQIPKALGLMRSLQQLDLSANKITQIPEALGRMQSLQQLDLSVNKITQIPKTLGHIQSLQQLDLSANKITQIPEALGQMQSLQQLDLNKNKLTQIPYTLGQIHTLQQLDLSSNEISQIPDSLETLTQLERLDLRRNPLPISPEVLGPSELHQDPGSIASIFNYYHQLRSGDVRPLNEAKLIFVGQGSVGKTSLINCLWGKGFNPNEPQTDGLNVSNWHISVNSKDVRLNVWDFGGQEIYHATHQFFLTKRSLYLLVCNCRTSEDENRLDYWLKLIKSFGDASPVIIVGNKRDEQPLDINRKALRDKYSNIKAILETSCQTDNGIKKLKETIISEVSELKEVYDLLPLSWFEVKEHLEVMEQDFMTYNEYIGICYRNKITDEQTQAQLITLLHNLGLVLNFRNHQLLQNTNVLNPDWVTQGIYALLSDDKLKTKGKGQLTFADLNRVLPNKRYPTERHNYLIELMKEFQLCFELPECDPARYLIPGILPKEESQESELEGDTLEFQFHYNVLPDSIISRFIVLNHEKIYKQIYWRSGVMLAYTESDETYNIARIKADSADNKIFIAISGKDSTRRQFLAIIRDVFNKIHSHFSKPTEHVPVPGHPEHPPMNYKDLLGLEDMGQQYKFIGELKLKLNLRQLLDGYEPLEIRKLKQKGIDLESYNDGLNISIADNRSNIIQKGGGDNIAGDLIQGDKTD